MQACLVLGSAAFVAFYRYQFGPEPQTQFSISLPSGLEDSHDLRDAVRRDIASYHRIRTDMVQIDRIVGNKTVYFSFVDFRPNLMVNVLPLDKVGGMRAARRSD